MAGGSAEAEVSTRLREAEDELGRARALIEYLQGELEIQRTAASERLELLLRADGQLKALTANAGEADAVAAALAEARRGMAELAKREQKLTAEVLELRKEGLLHSMLRRIRELTAD